MPAQTKTQNVPGSTPSSIPSQGLSTPKRGGVEKELFSWSAPSKAFKKRGREFWVRVLAIASIFGFILYIAEGVMPVILLISLLFLFYILTTVEPQAIVNKVTTKGIRVGDKLNEWDNFMGFWFTRRGDINFLVLETLDVFGRLELIVEEKDKEKLRKVLSQYLTEEENPSSVNRFSEWFSRRFFL